jgi:ketosteroid isomerase-like protein
VGTTIARTSAEGGTMAGHRRIVEQFYDRFGEGDLDAAIAMFSAGIRITDPGLGTVEGLEAMRGYLVGLKRAVPDARAVVGQVFELEDTVIVEGRFTGSTHAPLSESGASQMSSGARIDLPFADFARIREDLIVEYRTYYDQVRLLAQLGETE